MKPSEMPLRPALFLDRDGTLIEETHYLADPAQVVLVAGAGYAVARFNQAGIPVVVVTNQSGVARGLVDEEDLPAIHRRLDELLAPFGARVDAYYVCPHHPTDGVPPYRQECDCRKPRPGLLHRAARELGLDLAGSVMVGDKPSDFEAGAAAGCQTVLVQTGYGAEHAAEVERRAAELRLLGITPTLPEALALIARRVWNDPALANVPPD